MKETAPILLLEDNPDDAFLLQRSLQRMGLPNGTHSVNMVEDAVKFLEDRRKDTPIFVIVSLDMFLADGEELMLWMRHQNFLQQVPIVCIGSSNRPRDVQKAYDLGANAYFTKSVDMDHLAQMIRELEFIEQFLPPKVTN